MKNIFTPQCKTLDQIFNGKKIYRIPDFQRQYSWGTEQLQELWDDLIMSFKNKEKSYFLGSIVVVSNKELKNEEELIDGQQRLTTLMILWNVLSKNFPNINEGKNKNESKKYIDLPFIQKKIKKDYQENRLRLQSYKDYDAIFKQVIINEKDFSVIKEYPTEKQLNSGTPKYRYQNTAKFFLDHLKELKKEELENFVTFIFRNVYVIKIICERQSYAIKLFQVINDRGMQLNASDIIKAYLLEKTENKKTQKELFETNWKTIETNVFESQIGIDEFFVLYEYYKLKSNPKKQLVDEMKKIIYQQKVQDIMQELVTFSTELKQIQKEENTIIYSLKYLPWSRYINTMLVTMEVVDYPEKEDLLFELRRFFYIAFVSGLTLNQIKQTSFTIIGKIAESKKLKEIKEEMDNFITNYHLIDRFFEHLNANNVYQQKWLKPLMATLEYEVREKQNKTKIVLNQKINIDHILPKEFEKQEEWNYIVAEEARPYLNTLGNMALISEAKNKSILHKGFIKKLQRYQGMDENSNTTDGFTTYQTTIQIILDYQKEKVLWNISSIQNRYDYIVNLLENKLQIHRKMKILTGNEKEYYLISPSANATATINEQGKIEIKKGSMISPMVKPSMLANIKDLREELLLNGIIDQNFKFTQNYIFSSPSTAAQLVLGYSVNGRNAWKNKEGKTWNEVH